MRRPTGVTVVAVLLWLTGGLDILAGLGTMGDLSAGAGILQVAVGALAVLFGFGCWQLKQWAWLGTLVLMGVNAVSLLVIWARFGDRVIVSRLLWPLIVNGVVIFYLMQPGVKGAFRRP